MMKKINQQLLKKFDAQLLEKNFSSGSQNLFRKWLRYFLDFINKLREKKQSKQQQKQAYDAILIYYEILNIHPNWLKESADKAQVENKAFVVQEDLVS